MSATSRETVSRILSDFAKRGMIGLTKEKIVVFQGFEENNAFI